MVPANDPDIARTDQAEFDRHQRPGTSRQRPLNQIDVNRTGYGNG
jgi:hypothetical protein